MDRPKKLQLMMSIPKKKKYMRHAYGSVGTGDVPLSESNHYLKNMDEGIQNRRLAQQRQMNKILGQIEGEKRKKLELT